MMDMNKLRTILRNKWVGFGLAATLYTLCSSYGRATSGCCWACR